MKKHTIATDSKTALVTGAAHGIGRCYAERLAALGYRLILVDRDGGTLDTARQELAAAHGVTIDTLVMDMARMEASEELYAAVARLGAEVEVLVNNAGVTRDNLILRLSEEDFDTVLNANLKGAFLCCKEAARRMVRQRYGRIVNLSSVVGLRGNAGQTNYSASKAGLIGLTKSLAKELASRNVTVNAVAPGFIATDMTAALPEAVRTEMCKTIPEGRAGQPEDVANAVAFFAAEQSSYLTGQVLCVDGGMAM